METDQIKNYLKDNGTTQRWLAKQLGISPSYLCLILNEDRDKPEWFDYKMRGILNNKIKELRWQVRHLPKP